MEKYLSTFLRNYSGLLNSLPQCLYTKFECQNIEKSIFSDLNQKNKYVALDLPDNKNLVLSKRNFALVLNSLVKIESLKKFSIKTINNIHLLVAKKTTFDLIIFEFGNLPIIKNNNNDKALFLVNYPSQKVFFCGFIDHQKIDFNDSQYVEALNGVGQNYLLKKIEGLNYFIND
jgi:hypothetical protein